jgi:predicted house-cleaning NTP pyrophosphatase (Maf/HAM1 superfamily)
MEGCYYTIMGFPMLECLGHLQHMGLDFQQASL